MKTKDFLVGVASRASQSINNNVWHDVSYSRCGAVWFIVGESVMDPFLAFVLIDGSVPHSLNFTDMMGNSGFSGRQYGAFEDFIFEAARLVTTTGSSKTKSSIACSSSSQPKSLSRVNVELSRTVFR